VASVLCPAVRQETKIDEVPRRVRDAAAAAFDQQEQDVLVLDLVEDMLIDPGSETSGYMRRLRFAGDDCTADVDVRGTTTRTLDIQVSPDEPATIELRTVDASGHVETQRRGRGPFTDVPQGLTSLLIRWADEERGPARTAWVRL
jgi:hypothetical protein